MTLLLERTVEDVDEILWLLDGEAKLFKGAEAEAESLKLDLRILSATIPVSYKPCLVIEKSGCKELKELTERVEFVMDRFLQNLEQLPPPQQQKWQLRELRLRELQLREQQQLLREMPLALAPELQEWQEILRLEMLQRLLGRGRQQLLERGRQQPWQQEWTQSSLLENLPFVFLEKELVGIKSRKEDLVRMLVGESSTATRLVISLVGIAGVGKTTLASVVYQSKDVLQHFDCRAWINVSQFYSFDNLFSCLANAICPDEDCLDGEMDTVQEQFSRLNRYLMKKRYVIVFDDVRKTDFFQVMNDILPNNSEGCRIIITTRDNLIATSCDVVQTLQPPSEQMALETFYHNYSELPSRSRLCLMYFGIFPKDYLIPDVKLVKLWIAEGFVKEEMGRTLEQVAETYLNDLINRNLVQVSCISYDGTERMCRVHGFMHHTISSVAKGHQIFEVLRKTLTAIFLNEVTRCFYGDTIRSLEMTSMQPHASTVFLFVFFVFSL